MVSALLYLQYCSIKNRTLMRLKRLKRPKYLFGAIVGGLYFYFYFFRYLFGMGSRRKALALSGPPENLVFYEAVGALLLLTLVLLGWLLPRERSALAFSEAEVAFLFPAPISRKGLIHYKLLRSQFAILFTTIFLVLISNRFGGKAWIHAAGWWLALSTLNLHLLGASFARTKLLDRGITNWQRRFAILGLVTVATVMVLVWARRTFPNFDVSNIQGPEDLKQYARELLDSGPLPWLLSPFRLVLRPYFAPDGLALVHALPPALAILFLHYMWVVRSDVAFEEASVDASRKLADKVASIRSGNWQAAGKALKVKRAPFKLRPEGWPPVGLLWKNLINAGQAFSTRLWIMLAIVGVTLAFAVGQASSNAGLPVALGMIAAAFIAWSLLLGPQFLRQDFRQDLVLTEVLKTFPLPGWQIAVGELLAPTVILAVIQWFLIAVSAVLLLQQPFPGLGRAGLLAIAFSGALVLPVLDMITLLIPNAAVLLFPAWFQAGKEGPHGIEATGQRIIFMLGQLLVFIVALIPAAIALLAVFFVSKMFIGNTLAIPAASVAAALVLAGEATLGLMLLGRLFDRFDVADLAP
jgi:ABC-2 type transport system permease protein